MPARPSSPDVRGRGLAQLLTAAALGFGGLEAALREPSYLAREAAQNIEFAHANPSAAQKPNSVAHRQLFFMIGLPWFKFMTPKTLLHS